MEWFECEWVDMCHWMQICNHLTIYFGLKLDRGKLYDGTMVRNNWEGSGKKNCEREKSWEMWIQSTTIKVIIAFVLLFCALLVIDKELLAIIWLQTHIHKVKHEARDLIYKANK